jgi:deoxyribodipyrimidine photo-lyase
MTRSTWFPPARGEALARLDAFLPRAGRVYAAGRNLDQGPGRRDTVSELSPYIRRRLVTEWEVARAARDRHGPDGSEKFVQEVFWRTYWKGWLERRPAVWRRYRDAVERDRDSVSETDHAHAVEGRTGIACFDAWARELVETGYLHNHARMWFASIWIHTLRLPWSLGAAFFLKHLLDGDPASNTLSWRWVAGLQTVGKAYLAREDNIAKFTEGRFARTPGLATKPAELPLEGPIGDPLPAPASDRVDMRGRIGLLLTDEDLSPEPVVPTARAVAGLGSLARGGPGAFATAALTDRLAGAPCISDADGIVAWADQERLETVVTAYAPVGPTADRLRALSDALRGRGIGFARIVRRWDASCWPHATKGYFPFKENIPAILKAL